MTSRWRGGRSTRESAGILSVHYLSDPRPGLLLGFGDMDERRLAEAARRLAPLIRAACAGVPG